MKKKKLTKDSKNSEAKKWIDYESYCLHVQMMYFQKQFNEEWIKIRNMAENKTIINEKH